jgi:hypothetical protein
MLASNGEITPPCGVPASGVEIAPSSRTPAHRRGPVAAGLGSVEQVPQVAQQVLAVVLACLSVHPWGAAFARGMEGVQEQVQVQVVGQGREGHLRRLFCQLRYSLLSS